MKYETKRCLIYLDKIDRKDNIILIEYSNKSYHLKFDFIYGIRYIYFPNKYYLYKFIIYILNIDKYNLKNSYNDIFNIQINNHKYIVFTYNFSSEDIYEYKVCIKLPSTHHNLLLDYEKSIILNTNFYNFIQIKKSFKLYLNINKENLYFYK